MQRFTNVGLQPLLTHFGRVLEDLCRRMLRVWNGIMPSLGLEENRKTRPGMAGSKANARVVIVGAGPVGMVCALALNRRGIAVTVFEQEPAPVEDQRAATLHPPTLEMLDELGVTEKIIPLGLVSNAYRFHDRVSHSVVAEFDLGLMRDEFRFPFVLQYEQYKLTASIAAEYANAGDFDVRFSHAVTGLTETADGVDVEVASPAGTERHARRLRDRLRRRAQHRAQARRHRVRGLHLSGALHQDRDAASISATANPKVAFRNYFSDPNEWCNLFKVQGKRPPGLWRAIFPIQADETDERAVDPSGSRRGCRNSFPRAAATRSNTSTSTARTSASPRRSARAACCSPATAPTSTIRSAAWA